MLRILFSLLILVHGIIHLLGFVKEFRIKEVSQLNGKTLFPITDASSKIFGLIWLASSVLLIFSSILFLFKKDWWWAPALGAFLISQLLIIIYWQDAKYGTIINILILGVMIPAYGKWRFNEMVDEELKSYQIETTENSEIIMEKDILHLPEVIQKYIRRSGVIGKEKIAKVYLTQKGEMRTKPDANWMKVEAWQYFKPIKPSFLWVADVKAAPLLHLSGRDKYENGKGHMLIKALSLFPVADSKGPTIDQGTMQRYMAEIIWFPTAMLEPYIKWEAVGNNQAKATMNYGGVEASGIFTFAENGDVVSFETKRYYDRKEGATLETWFISIRENGYKEFSGIRIPAKSSVTWKLKDGDFTWFNLEIVEVKYN